MAFTTSALVTFALPTTDASGAAWPAANYGGATVFRDGAKVGTVAAPGLTFTDVNIPVGVHAYTVEISDSVTGLTSDPSAAFSYTQAAAPSPRALRLLSASLRA